MDISTIPALPEVSIDSVTVNDLSGSAIITVSLNQSRTWDVKVDDRTGDGSAQAGNDYTAAARTRTLSIAAGDFMDRLLCRSTMTRFTKPAKLSWYRSPIQSTQSSATPLAR